MYTQINIRDNIILTQMYRNLTYEPPFDPFRLFWMMLLSSILCSHNQRYHIQCQELMVDDVDQEHTVLPKVYLQLQCDHRNRLPVMVVLKSLRKKNYNNKDKINFKYNNNNRSRPR
jgi:hypothetical protein